MISTASFVGARLHGGFRIASLFFTTEAFVNALGHPAWGETKIRGSEFSIKVFGSLDDIEMSVTIYHEVLEAAILSASDVPPELQHFGEVEIDAASYQAHSTWGPCSVENLNAMLHFHGFPTD